MACGYASRASAWAAWAVSHLACRYKEQGMCSLRALHGLSVTSIVYAWLQVVVGEKESLLQRTTLQLELQQDKLQVGAAWVAWGGTGGMGLYRAAWATWECFYCTGGFRIESN